ncbi:MAG: DUF1553 domain-containing protein, partial [Nitrospirota bacterium]|nr:DUF1553 domain-containing protein [Nitrospirota bacterium]
MEVLGYSPEGARAYFALETKKALESVTQAVSGVPLRQVARSLKLFAQGLCGTDVTIRSLPDTEQEPAKGQARAMVSGEGRTIALPAILRRYDKREDNEVKHPKTGRVVAPKYLVASLGAPPIAANLDRRESLVEWLTSKDNPFFARAIANRLWSYFLGRGIIEPVDDI